MKTPQIFIPGRNLEQNVEEMLNPKNPLIKPIEDQGYISLNNISCTDANGNLIEIYDKIFIKTYLATKDFTIYGAASFFERQKGDIFLPSCALTCNILARLYELRHYEEMNHLLLQYKDHGLNDGWHVQNTIVNWKEHRITHYPLISKIHKSTKICFVNNIRKTTIIDISIAKFDDGPLEVLLRRNNYRFEEFIKNLAGLEDPEILVSIGEYFNKPTRIWFPKNPLKEEQQSAAWIGCRHDNFDIFLYSNANFSGPARGVSTNPIKKKR